jgi:hypothetical protein
VRALLWTLRALCKVQAKCVRGLTVGRRGATAVQRRRKAELEGGAGGRRWRAACAVRVQDARRTSERHRLQGAVRALLWTLRALCKVQAKCVRGLTVGRRGATAVRRRCDGRCNGGARQSWRAALEGGAGGRRAPFACKTRGGQVSGIAFKGRCGRCFGLCGRCVEDAARLRGGAAGSTAVRALQRSSRGWFEGRGLSTTAS